MKYNKDLTIKENEHEFYRNLVRYAYIVDDINLEENGHFIRTTVFEYDNEERHTVVMRDGKLLMIV